MRPGQGSSSRSRCWRSARHLRPSPRRRSLDDQSSSGAVLPGVTVEAASPVLIEKFAPPSRRNGPVPDSGAPARHVPRDVHAARLPSVKREGVEMAGVAVNHHQRRHARGDGSRKPITVWTGETPIVDIQSARRGQVLNNEVIKELPRTRATTRSSPWYRRSMTGAASRSP